MKKQKRVLKIVIMLIVLLTPIISFATNETEEKKVIFYTNANNDIYNLGENVKVTVHWESHTGNLTNYGDVQAIGFTLQYDASKLKFVDATFEEIAEDSSVKQKPLEEDFYNAETPGTLILSKASLNDLDINSINLNFKTTAIGKAIIKLTEVDCVADGNLVSPDIIDFTTNSLATIKTVAFGDVDLSGTLDSADLSMLMSYLNGSRKLTEQQLENADVNLDSIVDDVDLLLIRKCYFNSISLPIRYGDVNLDGKINLRDIIRLNEYLNNVKELDEQAMINADTNMDGIINDIDLFIIELYTFDESYVIPFKMIKNTNVQAIDRENLHIVTGFELENMKVSELLKSFNTDRGFEVCNNKDEILEDDSIFSTGTKVKIGENNILKDPSGRHWVAEFNVVIYGDTTGDGKINAIDALALIKDINKKITFSSEIYREAGRIISKSSENPTAVDALAIIKHSNGKYEINQSK